MTDVELARCAASIAAAIIHAGEYEWPENTDLDFTKITEIIENYILNGEWDLNFKNIFPAIVPTENPYADEEEEVTSLTQEEENE